MGGISCCTRPLHLERTPKPNHPVIRPALHRRQECLPNVHLPTGNVLSSSIPPRVLLLALWLLFCGNVLACTSAFQPVSPYGGALRISGQKNVPRILLRNNRHLTPKTQLHVSSIRSWFSLASNSKKNDSATLSKQHQHRHQNKSPIFFKRHPNGNNKTQPPLDGDHLDNNLTSNGNKTLSFLDADGSISSGLPANAAWPTALRDGNTSSSVATGNSSSTATSTSTDDQHSRGRPSLQYGIFANTTSSILHFPEYTSAWANTLSSTLHNTTSNAWNKVAFAPLPLVGNVASTTSLTMPSPDASSVLLAIPSHLQPNDTLTVADLQAILQQSGYIRLPDDDASFSTTVASPRLPGSSSNSRSKSSSHKQQQNSLDAYMAPDHALAAPVSSMKPRKTKQGVAFPQASVLNYQSLQRGTAVASAVLGMFVAATLWPNLWLMGGLVGAVYGHDLCSRPEEPPPSHLLARTLIGLGRRLARGTLQFMDYCRTLWFLYKTGELSYQYYKRYETMDQRFAIQAKLDAWNARFAQGKQQFDRWEQENEIGRTLLAGLRTVWLVDERSKRRAKQTSRYRLVQYLYDLKHSMAQWTSKVWSALKTSDWDHQWREFARGIRNDLMASGRRSWGARIGAVVASVFAVTVTGALFALSPTLLVVLAMGVGVAWPSWVPELLERIEALGVETRARGRGEEDSDQAVSSLLSRASATNTARLLGRYDKSRYHYYRRPDGSKRYYRTGQSLFRGRTKATVMVDTKTTNGKKTALAWPWTKPQKTRRPPQNEQWGLFGGAK